MSSPFKFTSDISSLRNDAFVVELDGPLGDKADLLRWLASHLRFPQYFGQNWDALNDCLRDLDWIEQRRVVIYHRIVPLADRPAEARTYLNILSDVVEDWRRPAQPHEFVAAFNKDMESLVKSIVEGS